MQRITTTATTTTNTTKTRVIKIIRWVNANSKLDARILRIFDCYIFML